MSKQYHDSNVISPLHLGFAQLRWHHDSHSTLASTTICKSANGWLLGC